MNLDEEGHQISVTKCRIRTGPTLTSKEVSFKLGIHQTVSLNNIERFGYVSKFSVWVAHEFSNKKKSNGQNFDMFFKSWSSLKGTNFGPLGDWRRKVDSV
ncbi:hypothetical protein TNCV_2079591 [Trichonephila clavipes]|nr:hypothetical protein TNCV_2079591 [Trichonephila clavipes]